MMLIMKQATGLKSMRELTANFNNEIVIHNIHKYLGIDNLEELPHYDTINNFLKLLEPVELEKIRNYQIQCLLDKRCFEQYQLKEDRPGFKRKSKKYWVVIVEGTGLHIFKKKHCDNCLRREYKDEHGVVEKTIYMHHVLEAKLVFGDIVISLATEFIENESEDVEKQDCELRAFERLAKKIRRTYPRLKLCLMGDSLYAYQNTFNICSEYN